jgi:hypothetical protein
MSARAPGLNPFLLGAGALALVALALVLFAPLADCPRCTKWDFFGPFENWDIHELADACKVCDGKRRVPPFKKWTWQPATKKK